MTASLFVYCAWYSKVILENWHHRLYKVWSSTWFLPWCQGAHVCWLHFHVSRGVKVTLQSVSAAAREIEMLEFIGDTKGQVGRWETTCNTNVQQRSLLCVAEQNFRPYLLLNNQLTFKRQGTPQHQWQTNNVRMVFSLKQTALGKGASHSCTKPSESI